jgi:type VI secretion system secreted protein Hcp
MAQVDYFLKIDGIPGESRDSKHAGTIEIESFSWSLTNTGSPGPPGAGPGAGKVSLQDFHFVARISAASPKLMLSCATGEHLKQAVLTARKAGGAQQDFFTVKMSDILISSFQQGGSAGDVVPTDSFSLNFAAIQLAVTSESEKGIVQETFDTGTAR